MSEPFAERESDEDDEEARKAGSIRFEEEELRDSGSEDAESCAENSDSDGECR